MRQLFTIEQFLRPDRQHVIAGNLFTAFVDKERAVRVAVKCDADAPRPFGYGFF